MPLMPEPIFVRTRYVYPSYTDFWRLVEASKFDTVFFDEIDLASERTYIFTPMNGEVLPHLQNHQGPRQAEVIWWNLERPADGTLATSLDALNGLVDNIWVSDPWFAKKDSRFTYVRLGGHPSFGTRNTAKRYDMCHLSYLWGRRLVAIEQLKQRGVTFAPDAWGREQQDEFVAASKLMLSLHQYEDSPVVAPIRLAVAASYAIPFATEWLASFETSFADIDNGVIWWAGQLSDLGELVSKLSEDRLQAAGHKLFEQLCINTDFRREVENALE